MKIFRIVTVSLLIAMVGSRVLSQVETIEHGVNNLLVSQDEIAPSKEAVLQAMVVIDLMLLQAIALYEAGSHGEAHEVFLKVLQLRPGDVIALRYLAALYREQGAYSQANQVYDELLRVDPENETQYRNAKTILRHQRPFVWTGNIAIKPSSNLNGGTDNTVFDTVLGEFVIDPSTKAVSGVGLELGLSGKYRHSVNAGLRTVLDVGLTGTVYDIGAFNSIRGFSSFAIEKRYANTSWVAAPLVRSKWTQNGEDEWAYGAQFAADYQFSEEQQVEVSLLVEERKSPGRSYRDGPFKSLQLSLAQQMRAGKLIQGGLKWDSFDPNSAHLGYDGIQVFVDFTKKFEAGISVTLGAHLGERRYKGIFPLTNEARQDSFAGLRFSLQNKNWEVRGFSPRLSCEVQRTYSNVALYDSQISQCAVTIIKRF